MKRLANLNLTQCEIQNAVIHNLAAAPSNPREGQFYQNTVDHKTYKFDGTDWKEMGGGVSVNDHVQNSDTGTSSATFTVGTSGVKLKNSGGTEMQIRNNGDTDYGDLRCKNLTVEGTATVINSNTVEIGDSEIELNSEIATSAGNSDGGISVKRLMADNATRKDAKLTFDNATGKWKTTAGAVTGTLVTSQLANKVVATVGDAAATSFVITHNLNTRDLVVSICEAASPYNDVMTDIVKTSLDTITVLFAVAPSLNQYSVTIVG